MDFKINISPCILTPMAKTPKKAVVGAADVDPAVAYLISHPGTATEEALRVAFRVPGTLGFPTDGDDTAMINAALATNGRVTTQPGADYETAGLVTIPAGHTLVIAEGSTITATSASAGLVLAGLGAKLIGPGVFDGAGLIDYLVTITADEARVSGLALRNSNLYGINLLGNDAVIDGNVFDGITSYALITNGTSVERPAFRGNTLVDCGQGVMLQQATTGIVADNTMQLTSGVGIEVSVASDFVVTGNSVTGSPSIGISLAAASGCVVDGNFVRGHVSIGIENTQGSSHNVISNNNIGPSAAGTVVGVADTTISDSTHSQIGVVISGNVIRGQSGSGVLAQRGHTHHITGNIIENCAGTGIYVENGDHLIDGNTVRHSAPPTFYVGIEAFGGPHIIRGNKVDLPAGANGTIGIRCAATSDTQMDSNLVVNGAYGYAVNNGTRTVINGNRSIGTTTASAFIFGSSETTTVLTHLSTVTSGAGVDNVGGATVTGPLVTI